VNGPAAYPDLTTAARLHLLLLGKALVDDRIQSRAESVVSPIDTQE
jgi:hypothetical protein